MISGEKYIKHNLETTIYAFMYVIDFGFLIKGAMCKFTLQMAFSLILLIGFIMFVHKMSF